MPWAERAALRLAVFAAGALLMALEVAAFRIIGKTFGSALRETTTVIAVFLAAMSVGYWAGGVAVDRRPRPSTLVYALLGSAATLLLVPSIDAVFSPRIAASGLALASHAFLATSVLFAVPTVLLAATSPIAIRLFATSQAHSGANAGRISALSTAGSIAGSLATAFFLIDWLASMTRTVLFVSACAAALALTIVAAGFLSRRTGGERTLLPGALSLLLLAALGASFVSSRAGGTTGGGAGKVVFTGDSPYHHVQVRDRAMFRELQFDISIQSRMRRGDPAGPGLPYVDAMHVARLLRPGIRRVLLIGLGGGTVVKQLLHDDPLAEVDAVEVDPLVVDVARRYFGLRPDRRLRVHVQDGRTFLARSGGKWDLVIVDAYTTNRYGDTIPPHLVTKEFFESVAAHLTPGGVLHFHLAFSSTRLMPSLQATIGTTFASVLRTNGEILASDAPLLFDPASVRRAAALAPFSRYPNLPAAIDRLAPADVPPGALVLTDDYAPVDTLLRGDAPR